jgi:hypothetical protein
MINGTYGKRQGNHTPFRFSASYMLVFAVFEALLLIIINRKQ